MLATLALAASLGSRPSTQVLERIVAIVGPQVITLSDVRAAVALGLLPDADAGSSAAQGATEGAGGGAGAGADSAPPPVVERLVRRELMRAEIERYGVAAPAAETIEARMAVLRQRFPSPAAFAAALGMHGMSEARLRAWIADDHRIAQYVQQRFDAAAQPTDEDVLQYYQSREREFAEDGRPRPFAEVRDEARRRLQASRRQALIDDWVVGLMRRTEIVILSGRVHKYGNVSGAEAPGPQGARSEHIGNIRATSNAAGRDASAAETLPYLCTRPLRDAGVR